MFFVMALAGFSFGQYYVLPFVNAGENPGGLNQDEDQTAAYMLANSTGYSQIISSGSSQWAGTQTIPFSFDFNGNSYTSYDASSNGVLTFSTPGTVPSDVNAAIPDASIPDNSILVWGLNLSGANDGVITKTFGTAPNRQHWITWASASWNGMNTGISAWAYWSIVLEETTNNIYIVDARNYTQAGAGPSLTAGIQIDASTAISIPGSPTLGSQNLASGGSDVGPADNTYYAIIPGTQPQYDMAGKNVDISAFLKLADAPFDIKGTLTNLGTETITSFDINYSVNGGATVTGNISGVSIAPLTEYTFTAPDQWTPSATGAYTIEVYASNLNGNADENTSNDMTSGATTVVDNVAQRKPLYEIFTSSTCGPCKPGNETFHGVVDNDKGTFVEIKYQQNFPGTGDPYCTDEAVNRRAYYAINSIPRMEIDGGWDENAASFTAAKHQESKDVPAFLEMNSTFTVDGQKVDIEIVVDALADLTSSSNKLYIAILEKTTDANVKSNGETEFYYVMKKMIPNENGETIGAISNGDNLSYNRSFTFEGSYRLPSDGAQANRINHSTEHSVEEFTDLAVIAWIQNDATKEVYQATEATEAGVSVEELDNKQALTVYPNPTNGNLFVNLNATASGVTNIVVFDPIGKVVATESFNTSMGAQTLELDLAGNPAGMYFIQVEENENVTTQKFYITE